MQHHSSASDTLYRDSAAWRINVESVWSGSESPVGTDNILAWVWIDGEMHEATPVQILTDEHARRWAEIDLLLLASRRQDSWV
jgi:hypothetical protein